MSGKKIAIGAIHLGAITSWMVFTRHSRSQTFRTGQKNSWCGDCFTQDISTCLLLETDGETVLSFGADAEESYLALVDKGNHKKVYFFRTPKELFYTELDSSSTITDENQKQLKWMTVLSLMITCLVKKAKAEWSSIIKDLHLHLVVILPFCSATVRTLVQDAVEKAEMNKKDVSVVTRREAVSLLVTNLPDDTYRTASVFPLSPGIQLLVITIDDNSIDTVLCRIDQNREMKAEHTFRKYDSRLEQVVMKFETLLVNICGRNTFDKFRKNNRSDWMELLTEFKLRLTCQFASEESRKVFRLRLPSSLRGHLEQYKMSTGLFVGDKIKIHIDLFAEVLEDTLQVVEGHIKSVLQNMDCRPAALLLVGGFVDPSKMQKELVASFPDIAVFAYPDVQKAVLFGACEVAYRGVCKNVKKLDRNTTIMDTAGRSLPALDVFAASIRFLKDDFIEQTNKTVFGGITEDDVHWVLTVPAIWLDGAKQFMREAALLAGIDNKQLSLALEPEAASVYCRQLPIEIRKDEGISSLVQFHPGKKYLICDAGGGTVDVAVHEVVDKQSVKEIYPASGGSWGGMDVNRAFEELLRNIFGADVFDVFCKEFPDDRHQLRLNFEMKKRVPSADKKSVQLTIPPSLFEKYTEVNKKSFEEFLKKSSLQSQIKYLRTYKLSFSADLFKSLFQDSVENIIKHLERLLKQTNVSDILMVGGYSESPILQEAIKTHFNSARVITPVEAGTCVMKGALILGHNPYQIQQRVLKYTYGIQSSRPFKIGDPEIATFTDTCGARHTSIFHKHVQKGQAVNVGESQTEESYSALESCKRGLNFRIFASDLENPQYIDSNCQYLGELYVELAECYGCVNVALTFSDTEITVVATDGQTGNETQATINFLG